MIRGQFCTLNSWEKASSWCSLSLKNFTKDEGKKYIIPDISLTWICLAKERFLHPHFRMWERVNQFYLKLKLLRLFHRYQIQTHGRKTSQTENCLAFKVVEVLFWHDPGRTKHFTSILWKITFRVGWSKNDCVHKWAFFRFFHK